MDLILYEDQVFDKVNFNDVILPVGEYDNCTFNRCDFSGVYLSHYDFGSCVFSGCNLSMTKINNTSLRSISFTDCKIIGLHFETANQFLFSVTFNNCVINLSSFSKMKMKKTTFNNSFLQEVDFSETDLTESVFAQCDLSRSIFNGTNLEKVDFRTSFNYTLDPSINRIKKAKFSSEGVIGLLSKYDIIIEI